MRIGFIGAGQMASAIATGIAASHRACEFAVFDPAVAAVESFRKAVGESSISAAKSNVELVELSEFIFIAVKPQVIERALAGLPKVAPMNRTFVSVVAGVPIARLQELTGNSQIIRTMPNTPCLIGAGVIAIQADESVPEGKRQQVRALLSAVGTLVDVAEHQFDAVTGLSGSGPAYVYTFIEAMIDGGVLAGLPRPIARQLALQTVLGATQLLVRSKEHPAILRDQVTSPGGTTIHGMAQLEKSGFRSSIQAAIVAATNRSAELDDY